MNDSIYINDFATDLNKIGKQIDSLGLIGFNDSLLTLRTDLTAKVQTTVHIMNYAKKSNKKLILKTTN